MCDKGEEKKMEVDDLSANGYQEQKEENPTVQDKQSHSLNQHDNDSHDGMKGTDMANDTDKLQETQNDILLPGQCDGGNSTVEEDMNDEENVDPSDDNAPQTIDEKKGKEEPVDDGIVNPEKSTQNTYDDHNDANAKSGCRKGLPICVICHSKCANKVNLAKHIEKYHKRSSSNSCPHCYENCKKKKSLNNHIDKKH